MLAKTTGNIRYRETDDGRIKCAAINKAGYVRHTTVLPEDFGAAIEMLTKYASEAALPRMF